MKTYGADGGWNLKAKQARTQMGIRQSKHPPPPTILL